MNIFNTGDRVIIKAIRHDGGDPNRDVFDSLTSNNDTGREGVIISVSFHGNGDIFTVKGETKRWDIHKSDLEHLNTSTVVPPFKRIIRKLIIENKETKISEHKENGYIDSFGNKLSLHQMVCSEPMWAKKEIIRLNAELDEAKEILRGLGYV